MISYILRWLRREPMIFADNGMLRVRMTAKAHVAIPKAERFKIKNPRFFMARRKTRVRA